jgi:hypothetical protein
MITRLRFLLSLLALGSLLLGAQAADSGAGPSAVELQRAQKIAAQLQLTDPAKAARVSDLIARQYYELSLIHATRDAALHTAKTLTGDAKDAAIKQARAEAEAAQGRLHPEFLARLATELTPAQIDAVKDGMTYGVLPLTFRVYQEMLPNLTADQKAQILAWLTEAREHAMDASTSEEKHGWFGKYKGRINNYLSHAGIDMKQAEKEMLARQKAEAKK